MSSTQAELDISAPALTVWRLISDVTRMGEWSPETTVCRWLGGATKADVGARFRGTNRKGWRVWQTTCEVTDARPGQAFAFRVTFGPVPISTWSYELTDTPDGCHVKESWVDQRPRWMDAVSSPLMGVADRAEHNRQGMVTTLAALARAAQSA